MSSDNRKFIDTSNLMCPMPVIRTQDFVKTMNNGEILEVLSTDPGALHDIPAWARINGHEVLDKSINENEVRVVVKVVIS